MSRPRSYAVATFATSIFLIGASSYARPGNLPSQNQPPIACFSVDAKTGLQLTLSGACSSDPEGDALSFSWEWGDGTSTEGGPAAEHLYQECPRVSTIVTLRVTDTSGLSNTTSKSFDLEDLDRDGDGLHACREELQATTDARVDADRDGLSDLVESRWWSRRARVFCADACTYPDPVARDIFVEVDHMLASTGSYRFPTALVKRFRDTFAEHGITLHVDQGRFGGGNSLRFRSSTTFTLGDDDVDRYYNSRFSEARRGVFHYVLMVHSLSGNPSCTIPALGEIPEWRPKKYGDLVVIFRGCLFDDGNGALVTAFLQELGHNLFGAIEPAEDRYECSNSGHDHYHDKYYGYAMYPYLSGGGSTYHPNRWNTDMKDMGDSIRAKLGYKKRVNKLFEFSDATC